MTDHDARIRWLEKRVREDQRTIERLKRELEKAQTILRNIRQAPTPQ